MAISSLHIATLNQRHDRKGFECGNPQLNQYLQQTARQHQAKLISTTRVASNHAKDKTILGYYTLTLAEIHFSELNPEDRKKLPESQLPVVRLSRLAVSKQYQGQAIGTKLLYDAMLRTTHLLHEFAVVAMVVDAKGEIAASYYQQFGFIALHQNPLKLYLPVQTIIETLP